jgi:hypothetical protein
VESDNVSKKEGRLRKYLFSFVCMFLLMIITPCGERNILGAMTPEESVPTFKKSKMFVQYGQNREFPVTLAFHPDKLVISGTISKALEWEDEDGNKRKTTNEYQTEIPYTNIKSLNYEQSKSPRIKTAIFLGPLWLLSKGTKHWLYIFEEETNYTLRLDKKEYPQILMELRQKTKLDIIPPPN